MSGPASRRIQEVFDRAVELPPGQRPGFLEAACAGDAALRAEVEGLLAADAAFHTAGHALRSPLGRTAWPTLEEEGRPPGNTFAGAPAPGEQVGRYRVLRLLGQGGMGAVYEAEQDRPRRLVALKLLRPGLVSPGLLARFTREAELLGRLQHPGIAQVYEAGTDERGRPFFALELVRGLPLDEYARRHRLDVPARLELLARACDAVAHAHERGIVHRDLKPANILVDEAGQPRVLDFGIARATDADLLAAPGRTETGQVMGTPGYMAPEQMLGGPALIGPPTDVYALGVVLFEALAGRPPHDLYNLPLHEVARVIREQEPLNLGTIEPTLRGDVETIVATALDKEPARRYPGARELADDLRRHLAHQPIRARPPSALYRLGKFVRRNLTLVAGVAGVLLALAAGLVASLAFALAEAEQRRRAEEKADEERRARRDAEYHRGQAERARQQAQAARKQAEAARDRANFQALRVGNAHHAIVLEEARRAWEHGDVPEALRLLGQVEAPFRRTWEQRHLLDLCRRKLRKWAAHDGPALGLAFSADGGRVASAGKDGTVKVWDVRAGRLIRTFTGHVGPVNSVCFLAGADTVVSGGLDRTVRAWDVRAGKQSSTLGPYSQPVTRVAFYPPGHNLIVGTGDYKKFGEVKAYDARSWKLLQTLGADEAVGASVGVGVGPEGCRVAAGCGQFGAIKVWEATSGKLVHTLKAPGAEGHVFPVTATALGGDGLLLASGCSSGFSRVWDLRAGKPLPPRLHHNGPIAALHFTPQGGVACVNGERRVRGWEGATGRPLFNLSGHEAPLGALAASPDGTRLVAGDSRGTIYLWAPHASGADAIDLGPSARVIALAPDGRHALAGHLDGRAALWRLAARGPIWEAREHRLEVRGVALSADGSRAASVGWDCAVKVRESATRAPRVLRGKINFNPAALLSPDGRRAALGIRPGAGPDGEIQVWDTGSGRLLCTVPGHLGAFSPDGKSILCAGPEAVVYDSTTGARRFTLTLPRSSAGASFVFFSPDGRTLLTGHEDGAVRLWDAGGRPQLSLAGGPGAVHAIALDAARTRVVVGRADGRVECWDTKTRQLKLRLGGHSGPMQGLAISPDGERIFSAGGRHVWSWGAASVSGE